MTASIPRLYRRVRELIPDGLPFSGLMTSVAEQLDHLWIGDAAFDGTTRSVSAMLFVDFPVELQIPGMDALTLVVSPGTGGLEFILEVGLLPSFQVAIRGLSIELRVSQGILRTLKPGTREVDPANPYVAIRLPQIDISVDAEGHVALDLPQGMALPPCMIGTTGIIVSANNIRWIAPSLPAPDSSMPPAFSGLYIGNATLDLPALKPPPGMPAILVEHLFIGTGGLTGSADLNLAASWDGRNFTGTAAFELFGFDGCLTRAHIALQQSALTECTLEGNIFVPYLDKVVGLSLGFDGDGGLTAVAQAPTCTFTNQEHKAIPAPAGSGYILTADTKAFKFDISRIEFHVDDGLSSISLAGRAKIKSATYEIPAVVFKGLRIDTEGNVAVEGGWLDVEKAKASSLKGFPFQITKIGFGAEADGRRWLGLNGGVKLAEGLPIGVSVEGLRVSWMPADNSEIRIALGGIGLELKVPGTFSFAGKVTFFDADGVSGFRGSVKLKLDALKLSIEAGLMVGQTADGTTFFFLFIEAELPAGIPLFASGAAIYGFAGLVATNLKPNRIDGEDWYYGYYRRPPVGVTDPSKWGVQRDAFAIGLGATVGSLPDTGFAFSAKALLVVALPGPQLLLQGKGNFLKKKPDNKTTASEGDFEALLVLDVPAKLFQANLAAAFKIPSLVEIAGGINVAFTWAADPPPDLWHIYLGEKKPDDRRIHAKLFKLLQGDSWLMVNRPGTREQMNQLLAPDAQRLGEFEMGSSLGIDLSFDFVIIKAWLNASLVGQAAISTDPQQFFGQLTLRGAAGLSVLGFSIVADLFAEARVKAPNPWYFAVDIEVGIKIDLLVEQLEFRVRLPLEFGNEADPLPLPVDGLVELHSDHAKVDEAILLSSSDTTTLPPLVPPDVRPLVVFRRPVQDRARFGSPGRDNIEPEDLGIRQVSYQLRHVVLLAHDGATPRLVGAAGELTVTGNTATFAGLTGADDRLPDLAGAKLTLFNAGTVPAADFSVSAGAGSSATLTGSPPQGVLSYRLTAPRPSANVQVSGVGDGSTGEAVVTMAGSIASPLPFRGGRLMVGSAGWDVLEATTRTVRIRTTATLPSSGAATLLGPEPPRLDGKWAPTGEPATASDSSTRLQVWARTPFAFYRHNELESVEGLDAFQPGYACGPEAKEKPTCTAFEGVPSGPLAGSFSFAGVSGFASGIVTAVKVGSTAGRRIQLGQLDKNGGAGAVTFSFDPPADSVWITGEAAEAGSIAALRDGAVTSRATLGRIASAHQFTGGIDRIEISGMLVSLNELCFSPGWTCVHFEAQSFPQGRTGEVGYAGLTLVSAGQMTVDAGTLEVDPPVVQAPTGTMTLVLGSIGRAFRLALKFVLNLVSKFIFGSAPKLKMAVAPTKQSPESDFASRPLMVRGGPVALPVLGLVKSVNVVLPTLGTVRLVPGLRPTPVPMIAGGLTSTQPGLVAIEPLVDGGAWRHESIDTGRIWVNGEQPRIATVTVVFPRPVARARVVLAGNGDVVGFAGAMEVCRGMAAAGSAVSLYADPAATAHMGWIDRVVVMAASQVRVQEICIDAGNLGWARYEQWKWSQGVQRSVESLYTADPVLVPGDYELRVHTVAAVTGEQPYDDFRTERGRFTVGAPAGVVAAQPNGSDAENARYPRGGPLTQFATYVQRTMPAAGTPLWYRNYDTAVGFNEAYVTRMYLDAGHELRVCVVNASGEAIRSAVRHVWGGMEMDLDAYTTQYIRTLNGDGTDPCATVRLDQVVRPESVTAGGGESLQSSSLHASEIRSAAEPDRVLHRFEFVTSRYFSFRHHIASFDGVCRRLVPDPASVAAAATPRAQASVLSGLWSGLAGLVSAANASRTQAGTGAATTAQLDAASTAMAALARHRSEIATGSVAVFDEIWSACFAANHPPGLPSEVRLSLIRPAVAAQGADMLLLESPEPIAWDRISVGAVASADLPLRKLTTTFASDFGRPDMDYEVEYGGIVWRAGVELWVVEEQLRARAAVPIDVSLMLDQAVSVEIVLRVDDAGQATLTTVPPQPGGPVRRDASNLPITVNLSAPPGSTLTTVRVTGAGVGVVSCTVTKLFVPVSPSGLLRITDVRLPSSSQSADQEVLVMAIDSVTLDGYTLRWVDALSPGASQLYVTLPRSIMRGGQRLRLVPGRVTSPVLDDALVQAGGAVSSPPSSGTIYQLVDPAGKVIHEYSVFPSAPAVAPTASLMAIPNIDGTRAFLVPPSSARGIERGHWTVFLDLAGDAGPDLDRWSIGGAPVYEKTKLRFTVV